MKSIITILILNLGTLAYSQEIRDIITDPLISKRCKSLLKERREKISVKQRLHTLILRNQELQEKLKPSQKLVKNRLELNKVQLNNNLRLSEMKVKAMENTIIRRGCPGIAL